MIAGSLLSTAGLAISFEAVNIPFLVATVGTLTGMYLVHKLYLLDSVAHYVT